MFQAHCGHFLPQAQNQTFLQRPLVSFGGKWYLENSIWVLEVSCSPASQGFMAFPVNRARESFPPHLVFRERESNEHIDISNSKLRLQIFI